LNRVHQAFVSEVIFKLNYLKKKKKFGAKIKINIIKITKRDSINQSIKVYFQQRIKIYNIRYQIRSMNFLFDKLKKIQTFLNKNKNKKSQTKKKKINNSYPSSTTTKINLKDKVFKICNIIKY